MPLDLERLLIKYSKLPELATSRGKTVRYEEDRQTHNFADSFYDFNLSCLKSGYSKLVISG